MVESEQLLEKVSVSSRAANKPGYPVFFLSATLLHAVKISCMQRGILAAFDVTMISLSTVQARAFGKIRVLPYSYATPVTGPDRSLLITVAAVASTGMPVVLTVVGR